MDLVRGITQDDDDVIHPSWRQLVQHSNGGRTSDICSDGPGDPAETRDNRSSGKVCAQGPPVKHTRFRCGTGKYTDGQVDNTRGADKYNCGQVVNTNERDEYEEEVSNSNCVESESPTFLHLAPNRMGPRIYVSRNNDEEDGSCPVVKMESTQISHIQARTVGNGSENGFQRQLRHFWGTSKK